MKLNNYIEQAILSPDTNANTIKELSQHALEHELVGICIPPFYVRTAATILDETPTKVITTVGYPMGYHAIPVKVEEAKRAIDEGIDELEMMINIAAVKDGNWSHVRNDISSVTTAAHLKSKKIKVVLETSLLTTDEIKQLCEICSAVEVDFVKNAIDYKGGIPSVEMITLLKNNTDVAITAGGYISELSLAQALIDAGASRIGTTAALELFKQA